MEFVRDGMEWDGGVKGTEIGMEVGRRIGREGQQKMLVNRVYVHLCAYTQVERRKNDGRKER